MREGRGSPVRDSWKSWKELANCGGFLCFWRAGRRLDSVWRRRLNYVATYGFVDKETKWSD